MLTNKIALYTMIHITRKFGELSQDKILAHPYNKSYGAHQDSQSRRSSCPYTRQSAVTFVFCSTCHSNNTRVV